MNDTVDRHLLLSRQAAMVDDPERVSVLIIGVGGIGSNAAYMAASLGITNITLVDFGNVEQENLYPGFFTVQYAENGVSKSLAVAHTIVSMTHALPLAFVNSIGEAQAHLGRHTVGIICTDSGDSRLEAFEILRQRGLVQWIIDARMGGPEANVSCFRLDSENQEQISQYLMGFDMPDAELACGEKATAPLTKGWIAGMIGQCLFDLINSSPPPAWQRYNLIDKTFVSAEV